MLDTPGFWAAGSSCTMTTSPTCRRSGADWGSCISSIICFPTSPCGTTSATASPAGEDRTAPAAGRKSWRPCWESRRCSTGRCGGSAAASSNEWRWPGRWPPSHRSCCWMSRSPPSIQPPDRCSAASCASCTSGRALPRCRSPMTSTRRSGWEIWWRCYPRGGLPRAALRSRCFDTLTRHS